MVGFVFADPELIALAELLATDVGVDAVFGAVALALDNGYVVKQLADSAGNGLLAPDGTMSGIEPDQEPFGLLSTDGLDVQSFRAPPPGVSIEQLKAALVPVDDFNWRKDLDSDLQDNIILVGALLTLVEMGYAYDQVVEGLVFGELDVRFATEYKEYSSGPELRAFGCLALVDATGTVMKPKRELVPGSAAVGRAYQCGRLARDGDLLTEDQARARLAGERDDATTTDATVVGRPVGGSEQGQGTDGLDGHYEGALDFAAAYARVEPEVAAVLTVSENVVVADVDEGRLESLTGALQTYNPEIVLDDGGICESDARVWFEADAGSATSTDDGFEVSLQWSSYEKTGDCGGFSPTEGSETGDGLVVGRIDQETGGLLLEIEFYPGFVVSGLLVAIAEGTTTPPPAPNPTVTTTTTTTLPAPGFQFTASGSSTSAGRFRGESRADWSGTYSAQDGVIAGSGTVSGFVDGECRDSSDAPFGPVSLTFSGSYRITGTVSEGIARIRLVTDPGAVDLAVGDTSKECVQSVVSLGEVTAQFPIGDSSPGGLALELPAQGGSTKLEYESGMVIEVSVSPLG